MQVLDSSAVIALIQREAGAERLAVALDQPAISLVNFAEVVSYLANSGADRGSIEELLDDFPMERVPLDEKQAMLAGLSARITRPFGLSLADRICLALAKIRGIPAVTGDRQWSKAAPLLGVEVELFR